MFLLAAFLMGISGGLMIASVREKKLKKQIGA
jgi:hypothetical protein